MIYQGLPCIGKFVMYISCSGVITSQHLNYIFVCIHIFVYRIKVSAFIFLCMVYNNFLRCTSCWVFFYISPMYGLFYHCVIFYICICIHMFVNIISTFTAIFSRTS